MTVEKAGAQVAPIEAPEGMVLDERSGWELVRRAERMLDAPTNAKSAETLWRQIRAVEEAMRFAQISTAVTVAMGRVRLRAEARWGELLGPAEPGGHDDRLSDRRSDSVYKGRERARKVAEVCEQAPDVFEEYLATDHDDPPTRAGLFRAVQESVPRRRPRMTDLERNLARGDELRARLQRLAREAQWIETHALDFAYARTTPIADAMRESVRKIDARLGPIHEAVRQDHHELRRQIEQSER